MTAEGEPGLVRPDKTAIEIIREEAVTNPDRAGFIDPQVVGPMLIDYFSNLTPEELDEDIRRASPHIDQGAPIKTEPQSPQPSLYEQYLRDVDRR